MKMSGTYLRETVEHLAIRGYTLETETDELHRDGAKVFARTIYDLKQGDDIHFRLETLDYGQGDERYYLEICKFHAMFAYSFQLDSWKHRPDRVEFKFYALAETGMGLSFILALTEPVSQ